jgi:hypothetical protein
MTEKKSSMKGAQRNAELKKERLLALSDLTMRATTAAKLGYSYGTKRDLYTALGYKLQPTYEDYLAKYKRQDIARAIIEAPIRECWRNVPEIIESQEDETEFEKEWAALADEKKIFQMLQRVDRLATIGSYAVLVLGLDDGGKLEEEATSATELLYLTPYSMGNASVATYEENPENERFGLPTMYDVQIKRGASTTFARKVHWTRVIHVAEDLLEDNIEGQPRLQSCYNRLQDLETVAGGSAEMFWRGAFPGYGFSVVPGASIGTQSLTDLQDEIEDYMHGLKRYLRLQGIEVKELAQQVADPSNHVAVLIDLIAAATRIPKRILLGSERGELASSMDEKNWLSTIDSRRKGYCEHTILRPLIDRLVELSVLSEPADGYTVDWPDLMAPSDKERVDIGLVRAQVLAAYTSALGAETIIPPEVMMKTMLAFTKDEIEQIKEIIEGIEEERAKEEAEEETAREEEREASPPPPPATPSPTPPMEEEAEDEGAERTRETEVKV